MRREANRSNHPRRKALTAMIASVATVGGYAWIRTRPGDPLQGEESPEEAAARREAAEREAERIWREEVKRQESLREILGAEFEKSLGEAQTSDARTLANFRQSVSASLQKGRQDAKAGARVAVDEICGLRTCTWLAMLLAADKVRGTRKADELIHTMLAPVAKPLASAYYAQQEAREGFLASLEASRNQFQSAIGLTLDQQPAGTVPDEWRQAFQKVIRGESIGAIRAQSTKIGIGTVFGGFAAIELYWVRNSIALLVRKAIALARKVLAKIIARLTGTATVSAVVAAADGPVPALDVIAALIAIGGAVWVLYDINKARKGLRQQLTADLNHNLDQTFSDLENGAAALAAQVIEQKQKDEKLLITGTLAGFQTPARPATISEPAHSNDAATK